MSVPGFPSPLSCVSIHWACLLGVVMVYPGLELLSIIPSMGRGLVGPRDPGRSAMMMMGTVDIYFLDIILFNLNIPVYR